ncbi:MAG: redox-regulated ATPase YchF [Methanospirillum sp.]|nr:redox-regulated ATPase YchF [Methanospirillum sp.]
MITLALAGKPNCGKSTFFRAATLADAEIANYPFTTIDANHGVAYVRAPCPCRDLPLPGGAPGCGHCTDGNRFIPIGLIDVAGLVPDAHLGRGLGNQFLDHLRQADAIIHVVDGAGATDAEGNPVEIGAHDPEEDIAFLPGEMTMWVYGILEKHWAKLMRQAQQRGFSLHAAIAEILAGLSISPEDVGDAVRETGIDLAQADAPALVAFCGALLKAAKPMAAVANRADLAPDDLLARLRERGVPPATAAGELALRNAAKAGLVRYLPGDPSFAIPDRAALSKPQAAGLDALAGVMARLGGTGVQEALNRAVFGLLGRIVVYPVEDETHFTDGRGRILPDAFLMRTGATPRDLAFAVHTEIGEGFLHAIDARTRMRIRDNQPLKDGDIIRIVSAAK